MVSWLIKEKWVKSDREALSILLLIVFISLSGTVFFSFYQNPPKFSRNFNMGLTNKNLRCNQAYAGNGSYYDTDCSYGYNNPMNRAPR
jgi:hypothetical protein